MSERRHSAIMFTDIVGYTALMGSDEDHAFEILVKNREIHSKLIAQFNGTLIKEMGDGMLISFNLASDAVRCAIEIQKACKDQRIPLKIGIHEGEMVFEGADVLGDGVNIASRLQEDAPEGCISISGSVYRDIKNKSTIKAEFFKEKRFKNVDEPIKVYKVYCEEELVVNNSKEPTKRNLVPYLVLAGLSIVIAIILLWQFLPSTDQEKSAQDVILDKSIAVLPFRNDSPDPENDYFCNGMVETILTNLQKIRSLRVKSRTDAEQYRNPDKDLASIARELKVAFILEGSIQRIGNNVRVNAQLIDGETGDHVWAEMYDGDYSTKIFDFQTEVAKKVASSLQAVITPAEEESIDRKSTIEIMAYDLYWRGLDMIEKYTMTRDIMYIGFANELFDKAISIDPGYSKAYAGKGHAYKMVATYTDGNYDTAMIYAKKAIEFDPEEEFGYSLVASCYQALKKPDLAIEYYLKAIELEPNYNWPYLLIGEVYCEQKNDYKQGIPYIEKAVKLDGRSPAGILNSAGWLYLNIGGYEKATEYYKHSLNLLPACYGNILGYFLTLNAQGKHEQSLNFIDSICGVTDCQTQCVRFRFWNHTYLHEYDKAEASFNQFIEAGGLPNLYDSTTISYVFKKLGKENEALTILENIMSSHASKLDDSFIYYCLASVHCQLRKKDKALSYLSKAVDLGLRYGNHDFLEIDPTFENLRDDPEFIAIVKRGQDEKAAIRAQVREMEERGEIDL